MTVVYRFFDEDGRLLYIGCTENLPRRMRDWSRSAAEWTWQIAAVSVEAFGDDLHAARCAESHAIFREMPRHNMQRNYRLRWRREAEQAA